MRKILALGDVVADPEFRGQGYGKAVTLAAFAELDKRSDVDVMLWQTGQVSVSAKDHSRIRKHATCLV